MLSSSLHLLTLLLKCADLISTGNHTDATDILPELLELSSPFASPSDRIAAIFSDSLRSHLLYSHSPPIPIPIPLQTLTLSSQLPLFHSSFHSFNSLTPLIKFSHFTSNQAIFDSLNDHDRVHVIDLDIMQGLQWPGLFHILSSRPRKFLSVRLTGFGPCKSILSQTGRRLAEFASSLGLPFEFNPIEGKFGSLHNLDKLKIRTSEVTVVHVMEHALYDIIGSDINTVKLLSVIRPKLVTIVEQNISKNGLFLNRFIDALYYYSALFDALGEGLSRDNVQRHQVEQQLCGVEIRNILSVKRKINGVDRWGDELKRVGFELVALSGSPASQASLLLEMFPWKGYTLMEDEGCLRLGWKDLPLLTASAWQTSQLDCGRDL